jgi:hypothetical protein
MAEYTANAVQTVAANQDVLFTNEPINGNCSILHRSGSGLVTLRGITRQNRARFKVTFSGNIAIPSTGTAGAISVAIADNGEAIASSTMTSTTSTVAQFNNVSSSVFIDVPIGCCAQISIKNISAQAISVQNANLLVERVA